MPAPDLPKPPEKIGHFRITGPLGQGGMAMVYRAEQGSLKRQVALKVVLPKYASDPEFRDRFLREAQAAAAINHPNVITCFDAGEADGQLFMAMELVGGGDLLELMRRQGGKLDERQAISLLHGCLQGLEAVEEAGLIHRDLKPANIFLTDRGVPKLADLGLARPSASDDGAQTGMILGTPAYMPPEQVRGVADLDIRADIYALGATLFHLVTGSTVFVCDNPMTTLMKVLNEPIPDPRSRGASVSDECVALMTRLLAKDRDQRPANATAARSEVENYLAAGCSSGAVRPIVPRDQTTRMPVTSASGSFTPPPLVGGQPVSITTRRTLTSGSIDTAKLAALARRILIDRAGMQATLLLAPKASFPRILLDQIVALAGLRHGLVESGLDEATRPGTATRRIILALGEPPTPGRAGMTVRGEVIPPVAVAMAIDISADAMTAFAVVEPGRLVPAHDLQQVLRGSEIRFGFDPVALRRLIEGPAGSESRMVIAKGQCAVSGRPAGFHLALIGAASEPDNGVANLTHVTAGALLAKWCESAPGTTGMDVLGRPLPLPTLPARNADACAGAGTVAKPERGVLLLRAVRDGLCQEQSDGTVRVVAVVEINGDLGSDHPPIDTTDVVIVRGNVKAGAVITSTNDIIILGNLGNAAVISAGSLSVAGVISPGDQPVVAAGELCAAGTEARSLVCGSLKISGEARDCDIATAGDVAIRRVIGGSLIGGGTISVEIAGHPDGSVTELWSGHNLTYDQQKKLADLVDKRQEVERERLVMESKIIEADLLDATQSNQRLSSAQFVRQDVLKKNQARLKQLEENLASLKRAAEAARQLAAAHQEAIAGPAPGIGQITIAQLAHAGVVARVGPSTTETVALPQSAYQLTSGQ